MKSLEGQPAAVLAILIITGSDIVMYTSIPTNHRSRISIFFFFATSGCSRHSTINGVGLGVFINFCLFFGSPLCNRVIQHCKLEEPLDLSIGGINKPTFALENRFWGVLLVVMAINLSRSKQQESKRKLIVFLLFADVSNSNNCTKWWPCLGYAILYGASWFNRWEIEQ